MPDLRSGNSPFQIVPVRIPPFLGPETEGGVDRRPEPEAAVDLEHSQLGQVGSQLDHLVEHGRGLAPVQDTDRLKEVF